GFREPVAQRARIPQTGVYPPNAAKALFKLNNFPDRLSGVEMQVVIGVLISFAAALVFFVVEPMLLGIDEAWRITATALVFVIVICITFVLNWLQSDSPKKPRSIGVGNKSKKDLYIEIDKLKAKGGSGNIASQNESGGNTKIKISDSDL
ncbi:hypothetical protein VQ045_19500, partial [Aurantimonas sp. E1-2-R+4]|uniref:hypothetical protein n=1 Tax=Aurantimonas sp. E1-2-R+4 TaxID=3113714 RepID=UPI002F93B8B3